MISMTATKTEIALIEITLFICVYSFGFGNRKAPCDHRALRIHIFNFLFDRIRYTPHLANIKQINARTMSALVNFDFGIHISSLQSAAVAIFYE